MAGCFVLFCLIGRAQERAKAHSSSQRNHNECFRLVRLEPQRSTNKRWYPRSRHSQTDRTKDWHQQTGGKSSTARWTAVPDERKPKLQSAKLSSAIAMIRAKRSNNNRNKTSWWSCLLVHGVADPVVWLWVVVLTTFDQLCCFCVEPIEQQNNHRATAASFIVTLVSVHPCWCLRIDYTFWRHSCMICVPMSFKHPCLAFTAERGTKRGIECVLAADWLVNVLLSRWSLLDNLCWNGATIVSFFCRPSHSNSCNNGVDCCKNRSPIVSDPMIIQLQQQAGSTTKQILPRHQAARPVHWIWFGRP